MKKKSYFLFLIFCFYLNNIALLKAQHLRTHTPSDILLGIQKLQVLGSVLYVAAHPDDENTALLAFYANEKKVKTTYLSLTRGDGGQNLLGTEQDEHLGMIRTQELLKARGIDGAKQFFTRANDFGFSKNYQETFKIWDKNAVLADVVWAIRLHKPDVVINRFPPNEDAGHGHHAASAVLATEAFDLAGRADAFPEQLAYVDTWQPKRLVWNSFSANFGNNPPQNSNFTEVKLGLYNNLLGKSYTEIAGESRSMHKSQGFGAAKRRGERTDYLMHIKGTPAHKDILEDIDLTWKRVKGGEDIATILQMAYDCFQIEQPAAVIPYLVQAYQRLEELKKYPENLFWIKEKQADIQQVIGACLGLWYEANAKDFYATAGESIEVNAQIIKRADFPLKLQKITWQNQEKKFAFLLRKNQMLEEKITIQVPNNLYNTQPYWLQKEARNGIFEVKEQVNIGKPENMPWVSVQFEVLVQDLTLTFVAPVNYKWVAPEEGELYRNIEVVPAVAVNIPDKVLSFAQTTPHTLILKIKAGRDAQEGTISLQTTDNWKVSPTKIPFILAKKGEQQTLSFIITPPKEPSQSLLKIMLHTKENNQSSIAEGIKTIQYPHIPIQTLFPKAEILLQKLDIKASNATIGYITGAGDKVGECLTQIGYEVKYLAEDDIQIAKIKKFQAIILGVRAFNVVEKLKFYINILQKYVENGGILVIQYNTNRGLVTENIAPLNLKIGRERVTEEQAEVRILATKHPILQTPNRISTKDFEGWVQERGLYFAESWHPDFVPILAMNDSNETEKQGSLLVANYGKGRIVYTGLAFFRQLPAGVAGAYRLFVNLIEKNTKN